MALCCDIVIGDYRFLYAHRVQVSSARTRLGDTCTIELPKFWPQFRRQLEDALMPGAAVTVKLGYDGQLLTEFAGYVADVTPGWPLVIRCEDGLYLLKRKRLADRTFRNATVADVVRYCWSGELVGALPVIQLTQFRIERQATAAQVLEKLAKNYGLDIYFRGAALYAGPAYYKTPSAAPVRFHVQRNVVSTDLTYRRKEDVRVRLKLESIGADNKRIHAEVGDPAGEVRTLHRYQVASKAKLERIGRGALRKLSWEGYRGKITTFGRPTVAHGQAVQLFDDFYPERASSYLVDGVDVEWGAGGYRRTLAIGQRVQDFTTLTE